MYKQRFERENKRKSRIGLKFNKLTIIDVVKKDEWHAYRYLCRCDCGREEIRDFKGIKASECFGCQRGRKKKPNTALNRLFRRYKNEAGRRGIRFELDIEQFVEIINKNCFYCNYPPIQKVSDYSDYNPEVIVYNGIDRKNNNKGYLIDNIVSCCEWCNRAKHQRTHKDFMKWMNHVKSSTD